VNRGSSDKADIFWKGPSNPTINVEERTVFFHIGALSAYKRMCVSYLAGRLFVHVSHKIHAKVVCEVDAIVDMKRKIIYD
jgi:hypothetical protein